MNVMNPVFGNERPFRVKKSLLRLRKNRQREGILGEQAIHLSLAKIWQ